MEVVIHAAANEWVTRDFVQIFKHLVNDALLVFDVSVSRGGGDFLGPQSERVDPATFGDTVNLEFVKKRGNW